MTAGTRLKLCLTWRHEGLPRLVASVALLDEVVRHAVGPGGGQGVLRRPLVLPQPRALAHTHKLGRVAGLCGNHSKKHYSIKILNLDAQRENQSISCVSISDFHKKNAMFRQFRQTVEILDFYNCRNFRKLAFIL